MSYTDNLHSSHRERQSNPTNASLESASFSHLPTNTLPLDNTASASTHSINIFPNANNIVLNGCTFVAAPGGTIHVPTQPHPEYRTTKLECEGELPTSEAEPSTPLKPMPEGLNKSEDQNQHSTTSTTLALIRELIESQLERKRRAMQEWIRANKDIEEAEARLARYRMIEAELRRDE